MLTHLQIRNYALIESLQFYPDAQLNIITGETGAGKSILLGALGLLMGNRADSRAQLNPEKKCVIEGSFTIEGYELQGLFQEHDLDYEPLTIIRREIAPGGKSRAFVNDSPVTLDILKVLSERLVDIHSQHDTILLGESSYQQNLLDAFAGATLQVGEYQNAYQKYKELASSLNNLKQNAATLKKEFEYNSFLLEELQKVSLKPGEQEQAEENLQVLEHAEEVKEKLNQVADILNNPELSVISALKDGVILLNSISKYSTAYAELKSRLQSVQIELSDISDEVLLTEERVEFDPQQIQLLKDRVDLLFRLHQKHGTQTIEELLEIQTDLTAKVEQVLNFDDSIRKLEKDLEEARETMIKAGQELSRKRLSVVTALKTRVESMVKELGIPNASFDVSVEPKEPAFDGIDKIDFLFSANKGFALQGLRKVASGGEFSRLMLVLKYILAENKALPTLIFDEIDTGVSGEVAVKMGDLLRQMSSHIQLVTITHLHQIAGKGTSHFFVYKEDKADRTVSTLKKLTEDERILEIAKMIGGENPSESSIRSAMELMHMI